MSSTLFGVTVPTSVNLDDGNTYVLGTRFVPGVNGTITHLRRYFPTTAQNNVTQGLYRETDQVLLGSVVWPDGTAAGWQQMALASPVAVVSGQGYQTTYFTPSRYVATSAYGFPFTSGDLTAGAANGAFNASVVALQYATGSLGGTAIFADVIFEPAGSGTTTVTSDLDLRWRVRSLAASDLDLRWRVRALVASDLDLRWRVLSDAPAPSLPAPGGWETLRSIAQRNREYEREERSEQPTACPNDGEPLETNARGELHCRYDGWIWRR